MHRISVPSVLLMQLNSFTFLVFTESQHIHKECGSFMYLFHINHMGMFCQLCLTNLQFLMSTAGCPYSCVTRAPHVFSFSDDIGTARAISQGRCITATWLNCIGTHRVVLLSSIWVGPHLYPFKKSSIFVSDKCGFFEIKATLILQVMVKMTLFSSLLGSVQESAYTMLRLANALFWRMFLPGAYSLLKSTLFVN
jgi:hypothetical protein